MADTKTTPKNEHPKQSDPDTFKERLQQASELFGFTRPKVEPAPTDEEYRLFTSGDHASETFRRVPKPSYRLQEKVAKILLKAEDGAYPERAKKALCSHNGIDESEISEEFSQRETDEQLLPLICRELPESWDIADASSAEVERMRLDFLSDT